MGFKLFEISDEKEKDIVSILSDKYKRIAVSQIALTKAKNMIANAISKSEIKIYRKTAQGKIEECIDELFFTLNIMPNPNETGTDFWKKAIFKLIDDGECLIVQTSNGFFVADNFVEDANVLKGKTYRQVQVSNGGESIVLNKRFKADNTIDLKMSNGNVTALVKKLNSDIDDLVSTAIGAYNRSHTSKYILNTPGNITMKDKDGNIITANEYAQKVKQNLQSADVEVLLAGAGLDLKELKSEINGSSDDITKLYDLIYKVTASAFDIPLNVFNGSITENSDATNEFITYTISWFIELLNDSFNAKLVGMEDYIAGERILVDMSTFKHIDVVDASNNLDKLYQDGWSHNDILKLLKLQPIDEEWADVHHTTKNYEDVNALKGGEGE